MNTLELLEFFLDGTELDTAEFMYLHKLGYINATQHATWQITDLGYETLLKLRLLSNK